MIKSLLTEYGVPWVINRTLYSAKLKMMRKVPLTESIFEKQVDIKRIDIFNLQVDSIESFLNNLDEEEQEQIVNIADQAVGGIIQAFSSRQLDYDNPINWHYNPLTKANIDSTVKWYQIPDFDEERGDIKVVWEVSRFTHFYYLMRAYLITKDNKYYEAFSNQINSWLKNNPYSYGANYKCGQECALRMINILMAYTVFTERGLTTKEDEKNVYGIVRDSYKKILANFFYAHKCIKNNHTFSEICGLIIGAWCCEDNKRLDKAYKLLDDEIQKQFMDDGGYVQFSFNYQRFVLQIIECIYKINETTGRNLSEKSKERILRSTLLMYQVQDECGDVPNYGSNDGALIFPVTTCGYRDFTPVINTVYALIEGNQIYTKGNYEEELLWFGKGKLVKRVSMPRQSMEFKDAGLYTLRHRDGFMMVVLPDYKTRPAQMDGLHIDLWHKGKNIFCDSGTYSYATEIGKKLALTAAHNTVQVDDKEQMKKRGPFLIYDWSQADNIRHTETSFEGTMVSKNSYTHTRTISRNGHKYNIRDEISGGVSKFYYHTPYDVERIKNIIKIKDNAKILCEIVVSGGNIVIEQKSISRYYLREEKSNCICIEIKDNKLEIEVNLK